MLLLLEAMIFVSSSSGSLPTRQVQMFDVAFLSFLFIYLLFYYFIIVVYIYAKSHFKYHTFEGYYICIFSKLRRKVHQKVWKCSLTFPLQNGIVTFYENCTNYMLQSII